MMRTHKNNTAKFKAQRLRVLSRDVNTCYYCGIDNATHVDHVVPKAMGGGDELDNLVAACASCNQRKGSKSQGLFLATNSADRKSTRLNSSHESESRMPSSA